MDALTGQPVAPTKAESALARESGRKLSRYGNQDLRVRISLEGKESESIDIPAAAVGLLVRILSEMAAGNAITLRPIHAELTTREAADLLGVSRPFLIKQLEDQQLAFRKVGTHHRILFSDLMAYKKRIDSERDKALSELVAQAQELGMGY